jgi:hypothetical protein
MVDPDLMGYETQFDPPTDTEPTPSTGNAADLFGYQTFVSIDDPEHTNKDQKDLYPAIQDMYTYPKKDDKRYEFDYSDTTQEIGPAQGIWQDPAVVQKDYDAYHDEMVNTVVSNYLCDHFPMVIPAHRFGNRVAITMQDLGRRTPSEIKARASRCSVSLQRSQPKDNRYTFKVSSSGSADHHAVTVKAVTKDERIKKLDKADLLLACSCKFWVYYGCEYHAKAGGYLDGKPKGTATVPRERDPQGKNIVCKHVYAVFHTLRNYEFHRDGEKGKDKKEVKEPNTPKIIKKPEVKKPEMKELDKVDKQEEPKLKPDTKGIGPKGDTKGIAPEKKPTETVKKLQEHRQQKEVGKKG